MDIVEQKDDDIARLQDLISDFENTIKSYVSFKHLNFLYTNKIIHIYAYNGLYFET